MNAELPSKHSLQAYCLDVICHHLYESEDSGNLIFSSIATKAANHARFSSQIISWAANTNYLNDSLAWWLLRKGSLTYFPFHNTVAITDIFLGRFPSENLRNLEVIEFNNQFPQLLVFLSRLATCGGKSLRKIWLDGCDGVHDGVIKALLKNNTGLEILRLNRILDLDGTFLEYLGKNCRLLRNLSLAGCKNITDQSIQSFIQTAAFGCFSNLNLSGCAISELTQSALASKYHELSSLILNDCLMLKDAVFHEMSDISKLKHIEVLNCHDLSIAGAWRLATHPYLASLKLSLLLHSLSIFKKESHAGSNIVESNQDLIVPYSLPSIRDHRSLASLHIEFSSPPESYGYSFSIGKIAKLLPIRLNDLSLHFKAGTCIALNIDSSDIFELSRSCPFLTKLSLRDNNDHQRSTSDEVDENVSLQLMVELNHLLDLEIIGIFNLLPAVLVREMAKKNTCKLQYVHLDSAGYIYSGPTDLYACLESTSLISFYISGNLKISCITFNCPNLKQLDIKQALELNSLSILPNQSLKYLSIPKSIRCDDVVQISMNSPQLTALHLPENTYMTDESFYLLSHDLIHLKEVNLCGCRNIGFLPVVESCSMQHLSGLECVKLSFSSNFTASSFAEFAGLPSLRVLHISNCSNLNGFIQLPLDAIDKHLNRTNPEINDEVNSIRANLNQSKDFINVSSAKLRIKKDRNFIGLQGIEIPLDTRSLIKLEQIAGALPVERGGLGRVVCLRYQFGACIKKPLDCEFAHFQANLGKISRFKPLLEAVQSAAKGRVGGLKSKKLSYVNETDTNITPATEEAVEFKIKSKTCFADKKESYLSFQSLQTLEIDSCDGLVGIVSLLCPALVQLSIVNCHGLIALDIKAERLTHIDLSNSYTFEGWDFHEHQKSCLQVAKLNGCRALTPKFLEDLIDHNRHLRRLEIYGAALDSQGQRKMRQQYPGGKRDALNADHFSKSKRPDSLRNLDKGRPNLVIIRSKSQMGTQNDLISP